MKKALATIDRKHFRLVETTMYRGYTIKIRRGEAFYMAEILDKEMNYFRKTRFCESRMEAANEAALIIEGKK